MVTPRLLAGERDRAGPRCGSHLPRPARSPAQERVLRDAGLAEAAEEGAARGSLRGAPHRRDRGV